MTNLAFPALHNGLTNDEQLGQEITLLAGQINAANHRLLQLIAEFERRKPGVAAAPCAPVPTGSTGNAASPWAQRERKFGWRCAWKNYP